jgi:hypothetical protein
MPGSLTDIPEGFFTRLAGAPVDERNSEIARLAKAGAFDFLDFGTHKGGGLRIGVGLGGARGLGVELEAHKAAMGLADDLAVLTGDIMAFPLDLPSFTFGICRHVLEHLPNKYVVGAVLWKLQQLCSDFIYIEQPNFDDEPFLNDQGLTLTHSTLEYHTYRPTVAELEGILRDLGVTRYVVGGMIPMVDSGNPWVHSIDAPPNRWTFVDEDPPKPEVVFPTPLFRDLVILVGLSETADLGQLASRLGGMTVLRSHPG